MKIQRRQLANSNIGVWQDGEEVIIHHDAGLTIGLTEQETRELWEWLGALHKQNEDIAGLKDFINREAPRQGTRDERDRDLFQYHINRLKDMYGIETVICDDQSVIFEEVQV